MIDLNRLKATRSQLLLAEVAGLLHDFGKVSSKFVRRYAGDRVSSFEYDSNFIFHFLSSHFTNFVSAEPAVALFNRS